MQPRLAQRSGVFPLVRAPETVFRVKDLGFRVRGLGVEGFRGLGLRFVKFRGLGFRFYEGSAFVAFIEKQVEDELNKP